MKRTATICLCVFAVYLAALAKLLTLYSVIASTAYALLLFGFFIRKLDRRVHARVMQTAIVIDVTLVLILEVQRHAVEKALEFSMPVLQQLHIGFSALALICYVPVFLLGRLLLKAPAEADRREAPAPANHARLRVWHIRAAISALLFRSLGFILMFSILLGRKT